MAALPRGITQRHYPEALPRGITAVDPDRSQPLFERFISEARGESPDIDVDFEHERREEVIQHIYAKYGRTRAGLTAAVITYRRRSALREVAKVFGLSRDVQAVLSGEVWGREKSGLDADALRAAGLDLLRQHYNRHLTLASIPPEGSATYDMLCKGQSVGVFQVESRAQMAMLPRLQPRCFHDLVVQVAIVRPGPIQGDMAHPYLRRRGRYVQCWSAPLGCRYFRNRLCRLPLFGLALPVMRPINCAVRWQLSKSMVTLAIFAKR